MKLLITGGAGYIGTNLCLKLLTLGYDLVVVDDFVNAKEKHVEKLKEVFKDKINVYKFDVREEEKLNSLFEENNFSGVIHLAAKKYVDESVKFPEEYLNNNIDSTKVVLNAMSKHRVNKILFASSVVVYGNPETMPVTEEEIFNPISPYAVSKMECEKLILEWSKNNKTAIICRFSNPAGANVEYMLGDDPKLDKKNLVPYICDKIEKDEKLMFNGNNHPTRDGTPIRDYIHINDLTNIVAKLFDSMNKTVVCNVARGEEGVTVLEVLKAAENVINKKVDYGFNPKREGDVSVITFSTKKLNELIKYQYENTMKDIVDSQLKFAKKKGN